MHSASPYTLRAFDPDYQKLHGKYPSLDKIKGHLDLFKIFADFTKQKENFFTIIEDEKKIYRICNLVINHQERVISGFLQIGHYGIKTDIINIETGEVDYPKTEKNAELIGYYFYLKIPKTYNEGLAFFQVYKGVSAKTLLYTLLNSHYKSLTQLSIQFNPLTYENSMNAWKDGLVKELKLVKFTGLEDRAERISKLGHKEKIETIVTLKPSKPGVLGKLEEYFSAESERFQAIELWEKESQSVKTIVQLNGKSRTFSVGRNHTTALCEVEAPECLDIEGGLPTPQALNQWFKELDNEFSTNIYPFKDSA